MSSPMPPPADPAIPPADDAAMGGGASIMCPSCGSAISLTAAPEAMPADDQGMGGMPADQPVAEPDGDESDQMAAKYQGGGPSGMPMPNKKKSADLLRNY